MAALDEKAATAAERKLASEEVLRKRVQVGHEQQNEAIKAVLNRYIQDKLVLPKCISFFYTKDNELRLTNAMKDDAVKIHPHALNQMCEIMGINRGYVSRLHAGKQWERELLLTNFNQLMQLGEYIDQKKEPAKFLQRSVNGELRGFLSRRYNRSLSTGPLLRSFLEACQLKGAGAIEAATTDIKTTLKCVLPMVFEPVEGEFVAFGATFTNSDFGAGRLKLSGTVMRVGTGTVSVLEDKYSKVHVGKPILESEIAMTEDTDNKVVIAAQAIIRDTVDAILSDESLELAMRAIQQANEKEIPWWKLKDLLNNVLGKKDLEQMKSMIESDIYNVISLPPMLSSGGVDVLSEWGAANLIGWFAQKEKDADRKAELQDVAGKLLKVPT